MAKYKIVALPKDADDYLELDLTPEQIQEYAKGGYIIEDVSIPSLNKFPDGGLVQLDRAPGAKFKKNSSGTWVYESGAPITDQFILQELNYGKGKPVGSPVVYGAPKPKINIAREEELKVIKNSPRIEDQKKATQIKAELEEERRRAQAAYEAKLYNDMHYEQPLDMMDWTWQAAAGLPVLAAEAPAIWGLAEGALSTSLPGMTSIPGATFGNALGSAFAVTSGKNLLEVPSQIQKGEYADAAANVLTGALDIGAAGIVSPIYKGTKSALSELGKFVGTEEGLLSNTYKLNPWANKTYTFPKPQVGELINNPFRNEITPIENLSNKIDYFHLKADPKNMPYAAARDTDFWHQLNSDPRFVIKGTDTKPNAVIDFPVPFGSDLIDARKLPIPISELDQFRIKPKPNWLKGYPTELPGSPNNSFSIFPKDPVPLPGRDLWFAQASKTVGADQIPEHQWFNEKNKALYEKLQQELAQQKAVSEELSGFGGKEALDKIDKSKVSNEAFKRLIMGDDLKFKMDDYPDTPRVPFTKEELGREGNKFFPKAEYQPMDAATREEINVLNNIERSTNRLPEAYQALLDIQALRTEMDARDFVRQFRYELKNPRTGKPYSLTEIKIASPNQIKTWRNEIERSLIRPILTEMDLQNAQPKVNARDFKFYSNKEGGSINSKLSKFIS
jgi:hypothetical protein